MGLHSVASCAELHVFWGKKMGNLVAIVHKWCRWAISLGPLGRWNLDCVCIQCQLLESVCWDPSATWVSQGEDTEAPQSDKWKLCQVQPRRGQTAPLQCPQPAPGAPTRGGKHGTEGKAELQSAPWPLDRGGTAAAAGAFIPASPTAEQGTGMGVSTCSQC